MSPASSPHDTGQSHAQGLRGKGSDPGRGLGPVLPTLLPLGPCLALSP